MSKAKITKHIADIVRNIKVMREEKRMSQQAVADKIGISQNAYSKIELGYTELTLERTYELAEIYGINVNKLITPVSV